MSVCIHFMISAQKMLSKLQKLVFSATLTYSSTSKRNNKDNFGNLLLIFDLICCTILYLWVFTTNFAVLTWPCDQGRLMKRFLLAMREQAHKSPYPNFAAKCSPCKLVKVLETLCDLKLVWDVNFSLGITVFYV